VKNYKYRHISVLGNEIVSALVHEKCRLVVDCTLGGGGHSELLLSSLPEEACLIGIDQDPVALDAASARLSIFGSRFIPRLANFREIDEVIKEINGGAPDSILMDLGLSSGQLDNEMRGFSFQKDGPLDMRMSPNIRETASALVNSLSQIELEEIFRNYGEERYSRRIARSILEARYKKPIKTTGELVNLIVDSVPGKRGKIHPATRVFQALRIAVNDEMGSLTEGLTKAIFSLNKRGVIAVISYHSLEDRIVKKEFMRLSGRCICPSGLPLCKCGRELLLEVRSKKPVLSSENEIKSNPRARSAKLRVAMRIA
jgi:16S rRNA (cytosine1402-N4)-methyltransferase